MVELRESLRSSLDGLEQAEPLEALLGVPSRRR